MWGKNKNKILKRIKDKSLSPAKIILKQTRSIYRLSMFNIRNSLPKALDNLNSNLSIIESEKEFIISCVVQVLDKKPKNKKFMTEQEKDNYKSYNSLYNFIKNFDIYFEEVKCDVNSLSLKENIIYHRDPPYPTIHLLRLYPLFEFLYNRFKEDVTEEDLTPELMAFVN